jgi:hypothetical protein
MTSDAVMKAILNIEDIKKIDPLRKINIPDVNKNILYILAKINGSTNKYDTESIKYVHKIYPQLQLLEGDMYIKLVDKILAENKKNEGKVFSQYEKHMVLLICLDEEYYDGVYLTYSQTFSRSIEVNEDDGMCDFVIKSPNKLNSIVLENKHGENNIVLNDHVVEKYVNGIYEYKFVYDDNTPYMTYPQFIKHGSSGDKLYINVDSDEQLVLEYKRVILHGKYIKDIGVIYNIIPTNKLNVYMALGSAWFCSVLIDLNNDTYQGYGSKEIYNLSEQVNKFKFRETVEQATGIHDLIKIASIKYVNKGFNIYVESLTLDDIVEMDSRYVKVNDYLYLNGVMVVCANTYKKLSNAYIHINSIFNSLLFEKLTMNELGYECEIKLDYPLFVLKGDFGTDGGFVYNLVNGDVVQICKYDTQLCIKYNDVIIFEQIALTKYQIYERSFDRPYNKLCVTYKYDCVAPDMNWFLDDNGKCYVYYDGVEYCTMPPQVHYIVPVKYKNYVVNKLELEGYKVHVC